MESGTPVPRVRSWATDDGRVRVGHQPSSSSRLGFFFGFSRMGTGPAKYCGCRNRPDRSSRVPCTAVHATRLNASSSSFRSKIGIKPPTCHPGRSTTRGEPGPRVIWHVRRSRALGPGWPLRGLRDDRWGERGAYLSASFAFFTRSASTYTCPPISRNLALIWSMPAWAAAGSTTVVSCASSTWASFSVAA